MKSALRQLRAQEAELRREALSSPPRGSAALGVNPFRLCALGDRWVGLLRGSSELALLDASLHEVARRPSPQEPMSCAVFGDRVAVVGARLLSIYRVAPRSLELERTAPLPNAVHLRAVAAGERLLYVADDGADALHVVGFDGAPKGTHALCRRPIALALTGSYLVANCLYDHALSVRRLVDPGRQVARVGHDGPLWAVSALEDQRGLWLAASGVEDRPLQRFDGAFGYVDSFAYLYRIEGSRVERRWAANVSELSLLVPKAIRLQRGTDEPLSLWVSSAGSDKLARFDFDERGEPTQQRVQRFAPGVTDLGFFQGRPVAASPLLDAFVTLSPEGTVELRKPTSTLPEPSSTLRLGEALAFTELIAPRAKTEGAASRFTCETCHFEGGVDARVHHTGRDQIHVVTRPLFGLLRNAPHFSRALDPDLTSVSHNEFRVASLGNGYDPWFALRVEEFPWLAELGVQSDVTPQALRGALLEFLARFEPVPNAHGAGRVRFAPAEEHGARLFLERCEGCHAARLASDDPNTRVEPERWQASIFEAGGPLIWARGDYAFTGVTPYVNERGTRIASLRRAVDKYPYFTNGSAHSLAEVVAHAGERDGQFSHAAESSLDAAEQAALVEFLELL